MTRHGFGDLCRMLSGRVDRRICRQRLEARGDTTAIVAATLRTLLFVVARELELGNRQAMRDPFVRDQIAREAEDHLSLRHNDDVTRRAIRTAVSIAMLYLRRQFPIVTVVMYFAPQIMRAIAESSNND